jgi:putative endopeptidase
MFRTRLVRALMLLSVCVASSVEASPSNWPGGDNSVRPGLDFYGYANGSWMATTVIPADRAGFSTATMLSQSAEASVRTLLETAAAGPSSGESGQVGAYYAAFMDERRIEALGGRPLGRELRAIRAAGSHMDLARLMGRANASFLPSLFALSIDYDSHDAARHAVYVGQGGLGLPDRNDYLSADAAPLRSAYLSYVARLLHLEGWPEPEKAAASVLKFETLVARASWSAQDQRDQSRIYNLTSWEGLAREAPGFPWKTYLVAAGLKPARVVVVERSAVSGLAKLYAGEPLDTLKAWAAFHLADNAAPDLAQSYADAWFDLHGRRLQGADVAPARWRRALRQVAGGDWKGLTESRGALGDAVGRMYVARNLDPHSQAMLRNLVDEMKTALRARISASSRMSPPAKAEAFRKVDAYRIEVGAPVSGDTYRGLVIRRDDLYGDVERASAYAWAADIASLNRPVDAGRWSITPQTVNAYNDGALSLIVFTAALLQPPFFDSNADAATIYGSVGATIGHELTHGYDDQGRQFDAQGRHRNWWTPEDNAHFAMLSQRVVDRYSACEEAPGLKVNGHLTLGENLADIGGLQLAWHAYQASLRGRTAPVIDGLSGDQRFFLAFAKVRRDKRRPEALRADVLSDPHSPDRCRVNEAVREVDAWYNAFDVGPSDRLFLSPEARTTIW